MSQFHAVVWLDHKEARVFHFNVADVEKQVIHPDHAKHHAKSGRDGGHHQPEDKAYYQHIHDGLQGAEEILIAGPGQAKLALMKFLQKHDHAMSEKVVGLESIDHPTDNQLVAYARQYFKAADRMMAQLP